MLPSFKTLNALVFPLTLLNLLHSVSAFQFCHLNNIKSLSQIDFCFAANILSSTSTNDDDVDFLLTISSKFSGGKGWVALGTGPVMDNSLMFVFYAGESENETIASIRTTNGHNPPKQAPNLYKLEIQTMTIDEEGYHVVTITCRGCTTWKGNPLSDTSDQAWIWATNPRQMIAGSDLDIRLLQHSEYGKFSSDMSQGNFDTLPSVASDRTNRNTNPPSSLSSKTRVIHAILSTTVTLLFAVGMCIQSSSWSETFRFTTHWRIQLTAIFLFITSVGLGIRITNGSIGASTVLRTHQYLGLSLFLFAVASILLGYKHHAIFLSTAQKSTYTLLHIWSSRIIWFFIAVNGFLGIASTDHPWSSKYIYLALIFIETCLVLFHSLSNYHKELRERWDGNEGRYDPLTNMDGGNELESSRFSLIEREDVQ